jgi:hypothetical protein
MEKTRNRFTFITKALISVTVLAAGCGVPPQSTSEPHADATEGLAIASRVFEAADPAAAYAGLSAEERAKVDGVTTPGEVEVEETLVDKQGEELDASAVVLASYSGCYEWHQKYLMKSHWGNTVYSYWQSTSVCVSRGSVISVRVYDTGGETSTPGWRIVHDPTTATKNVGWEGRGKAQYYFVFGAGGWDLVHPSDCIQQRLNANGHDHLTSASCDLAEPLP